MAASATPPRRILVATDLSAQAGKAVRRAAQLGDQHRAQVSAVHVVPEGLAPELTEFARSRLRSHLDEYARTAATAVVRHGSVARAIDAEAGDGGADLLVVGAHGAHRLAGAFLGSTSANLVRVSRVPVLVVRNPPGGPYRTVVLAVDTSPASATAARTATCLTPQADHIVVHANVVLGESLMRMHGAGDEQLDQLRAASADEVRGDITALAAELVPPVTRIRIESGRPETLLPELCRRHVADLVAVGTGGRSPLGYALLGSVAQHLLRHAPSDVLVVPSGTG
ncbi:universal stress protein [Pseudonocardia sp.]|uniref:universal stress protein n=1 Tax=Pseudonocardia sp. TaxID=60912 RepID=UPI003D0FD88B